MTPVTIEIPRTITSRLVIATSNSIDNPLDFARRALASNELEGLALTRSALEALDTPQLQISGHPVPAAGSPRLADIAAPTDEELRRAQEATFHLVVTSAVSPSAQPRPEQAARLTAKAMAHAAAGVVIDLPTEQIIGEGDPPEAEAERFVLGDDWMAVFVSFEADNSDRTTAVTAGLVRFGLPELRVRAVPIADILAAATLLRAVASQLLAERSAWLTAHEAPGTWTLAAERTVGAFDVSRYWGLPWPDPDPAPHISVRLVPETRRNIVNGGTLLVAPPQNLPGDPSLWLPDTVAPALPVLKI